MPQLVKKRRSGWAVLAAGALVASLLAVGTGPAAAVEIEGGEDDPAKASHSTGHSACVGDAVGDHGFTDVPMDSVHYDAINCIAYYGVTVGKTAETYDPSADATRSQMVLFMERAADLTDADADDTLGDFPENGSDPVSRTDMAVLLVRLLASAEPGLVQVSDEGEVTYTRDRVRLSTGKDGTLDYFADTRPERSGVSRYEDNLITAAFELGIAKGNPDATFAPHDAVTRAQMASLITRALGHTTVRPVGISAQQVGGDVFVSLRDNNFEPIQNAPIDGFEVKASRTDDALRSDGSCARIVDPLEGDEGACEIDNDDPLTDDVGDVEYAVGASRIGKGLTVWAFTGDDGDEFDVDNTDHVKLDVTPSDLEANRALITTSLRPAAQFAKFGSTITVSLQLQNTETGDAIDVDDRSNDYQYDLTVEKLVGGVLISHTEDRLKVGEDGSASFDVTHDDPDPDPDSNDPPVVVEYEIEVVADTHAEDAPPTHNSDHGDDSVSHLGIIRLGIATPDDDAAEGAITFDDDRSRVNVVSVQTKGYEYFDDDGETVHPTVLVFDQYGAPVGREQVRVSDEPRGGLCATDNPVDQWGGLTTYTTGRRSGAVRVGYSYGDAKDDPDTADVAEPIDMVGKQTIDATTAGADGQFGDGGDCAIAAGDREDDMYARPNVEGDSDADPMVTAVMGIPDRVDDPATDVDESNDIAGDVGDVAAFYPGASQEFLDDFTYTTRGVVSGHEADTSGDDPATEDTVEDGFVSATAVGNGIITTEEFNALYDTHYLLDHDDNADTPQRLTRRTGAAGEADLGPPNVQDVGDYDEDNNKATILDLSADVMIDERGTFYWLNDDSDASTKGVTKSGTIVAGDAANHEVVVEIDTTDDDTDNPDTWVVVIIDDNDRFTTTTGDGTSTTDMDSFLDVLEDALDDPGAGTLAWTYYNHRDPDDITNWHLTYTG